MGFKSSGDPADRRARNDKNTSHPLDSHADRFAGGRKGKAPLVAGSQPHAEFDPGVYLTAAQAAPAVTNQPYHTQRGGGSACSAATTTDSEPRSGTTDASATGAMFLSSNCSSAMSVV